MDSVELCRLGSELNALESVTHLVRCTQEFLLENPGKVINKVGLTLDNKDDSFVVEIAYDDANT